VAIANRTPERARDLAESLRARLATFSATRLTPMALDEAIRTHADGSALIVNTTSLGMTPNEQGLPWLEEVPFQRGQTVYDLVYAPAETRLLRLAAAQGARALGGIGMLVQQGALAFSSFTGEPAPVKVMRAAAVAGAAPVAGAHTVAGGAQVV
jgi:shikimate dehydrogenase